MPKSEERIGPLAVVAPIADQQSLGVRERAIVGLGSIHRCVGLGARDRDREPPARLGVAAQDVRQRFAERLAGQPRLDDSRHVVDPGHDHRHPRVQHDDCARVGGRDPADQLVLATHKTHAWPVEALALAALRGADDDNRHIRRRRCGDRFLDQRRIVGLRRDAEAHRHETSFGPELDSDVQVAARAHLHRHPQLGWLRERLDDVARLQAPGLGHDGVPYRDADLADTRRADHVAAVDLRAVAGAHDDLGGM